jgi:hypothetical protein
MKMGLLIVRLWFRLSLNFISGRQGTRAGFLKFLKAQINTDFHWDARLSEYTRAFGRSPTSQ